MTATETEPLAFFLPPTKTWAVRSFLWWTREQLPQGDDRDGTLTIYQSKKVDNPSPSQRECNEYHVEEVMPEPGVMGRQFWAINTTGDRDGEVYKVTLGPVSRCTCDGSRLGKVECKHVAGLAKLAALGGLPVKPLRPEGGA